MRDEKSGTRGFSRAGITPEGDPSQPRGLRARWAAPGPCRERSVCLSQGALGSRELRPSRRSPTRALAVERVESTRTSGNHAGDRKPLLA